MEKEYAQAIYSLAMKDPEGSDKLVSQLVWHLSETGRQKLLPRILRELTRLEARNRSLEDSFEVASAAEVDRATTEARPLGVTATPVVNEHLISGWRARIGGRSIDRSGKQALIELYRSITAHA